MVQLVPTFRPFAPGLTRGSCHALDQAAILFLKNRLRLVCRCATSSSRSDADYPSRRQLSGAFAARCAAPLSERRGALHRLQACEAISRPGDHIEAGAPQ